jgi:hypothetical protein
MKTTKRVPFFAELVGGIPTVFKREAEANYQIDQFETMKEAKAFAAEKNRQAKESTRQKFVKYLGPAHINAVNLALYESGLVRVEHVANQKCIGMRAFESTEEAQEWFDSLSDNNTSRTMAAINALQAADYGYSDHD